MDPQAAHLIDFLKNQIMKNGGMIINEQTPLVSSGLVDSFALVDIVLELERMFNCSLPISRIGPEDMDTVYKMLELTKRLGKPRR